MSVHRLVALKRRYASSLLNLVGVVGVGVGPESADDPASALSIVVFVERGATVARVGGHRLVRALRSALDEAGYSLQFEVCGAFSSKRGVPSDGDPAFRGACRPLQAGFSVGTAEAPSATGTAGLVVGDADRRYLLGNAHVLNGDNSNGAYDITQPGQADGGAEVVGSLARSTLLLGGHRHFVDAALIALAEGVEASLEYPGVGALKGYASHYGLGLKLTKAGRTTGEVQGVVRCVDVDVKINFAGKGELCFVGQTLVAPRRGREGAIQDHGDSGAVWVSAEDGLAVALSNAVSDEGGLCIAAPFAWVAQILEVGVPGGEAVRLVAEGDDVPCQEPLGPLALRMARQQLVVPGGEVRDAEPPAGLKLLAHTGVGGATADPLDCDGTQLSGNADGFTTYDLRVLYSGQSYLFARVVAVNTPPAKEHALSGWFADMNTEYWFYHPGRAAYVGQEGAEVTLQVVETGAWKEELPFTQGALNPDVFPNVLPAMPCEVEPESCEVVADPSSVKAYRGEVMYGPFKPGEEMGIDFKLGDAYSLTDATQAAWTARDIELVTWFYLDTDADSRPKALFAGAEDDAYANLDRDDLGSGAWYAWADPERELQTSDSPGLPVSTQTLDARMNAVLVGALGEDAPKWEDRDTGASPIKTWTVKDGDGPLTVNGVVGEAVGYLKGTGTAEEKAARVAMVLFQAGTYACEAGQPLVLHTGLDFTGTLILCSEEGAERTTLEGATSKKDTGEQDSLVFFLKSGSNVANRVVVDGFTFRGNDPSARQDKRRTLTFYRVRSCRVANCVFKENLGDALIFVNSAAGDAALDVCNTVFLSNLNKDSSSPKAISAKRDKNTDTVEVKVAGCSFLDNGADVSTSGTVTTSVARSVWHGVTADANVNVGAVSISSAALTAYNASTCEAVFAGYQPILTVKKADT